MKQKLKNNEVIIGRIYEHDLKEEVVKREDSKNKGTHYICGTISIAIDEDLMNIVDVHYTYITALTKSGKTNPMFNVMKQIMENGKTVLTDGKEEATIVKAQASLTLNEFYSSNNSLNGEDQLVSVKRNEGGGFNSINILNISAANEMKAVFDNDVLLYGSKIVEADPEKNINEDYMVLYGYIFNWQGAIFPVDFTVKNPKAITYFESQDISKSNPLFTELQGIIKSEIVVTKKVEENAFGDPIVKEFKKNIKEWIVTWASTQPYEVGDSETGITSDELKDALAKREVYLADVKQKQDEWKATRVKVNNSGGVTAASGGFDF